MSPTPFQKPAVRIASLVPSLTETVCDLGVGGRLVAVTDYCSEPEDVIRFVPRIGTTKRIDREALLATKPDLVLANGEENLDEDIAWISQRVPVHVSMPSTVPEAADAVREIGRRLGVVDAAESFLLEIEAWLIQSDVERLERSSVRVFYPIWRTPWVSCNQQTYLHDLLTRAGAVNVCAELGDRYPTLDESALGRLRPDVVLLPGAPFAFRPEHRVELLEKRTFGHNVPILIVDGRNFCWHGTRTGRGLGRALGLLRPFRRSVGARRRA
jgi:ABC-type hemin transport system substrate-binding protein